MHKNMREAKLPPAPLNSSGQLLCPQGGTCTEETWFLHRPFTESWEVRENCFLPYSLRFPSKGGSVCQKVRAARKQPATFKDRLVFSESFQVIITSLSIETLGTNLQLPSDG